MRTIEIKDNGLVIKPKTATVTLEWYNNEIPVKQLEALAILLGAYNKYGRKIDLAKHRERIEIFGDLLKDIESEI